MPAPPEAASPTFLTILEQGLERYAAYVPLSISARFWKALVRARRAQSLAEDDMCMATPAIAGDRLVYLHRVGDMERVECRHPENGRLYWQFEYATDFSDRYGYNNGPRASPVIDENRVYIVGAQGQLHCLDLGTGKLGRDQVEGYAQRKGMTLEEAERWLAPVLGYETG